MVKGNYYYAILMTNIYQLKNKITDFFCKFYAFTPISEFT